MYCHEANKIKVHGTTRIPKDISISEMRTWNKYHFFRYGWNKKKCMYLFLQWPSKLQVTANKVTKVTSKPRPSLNIRRPSNYRLQLSSGDAKFDVLTKKNAMVAIVDSVSGKYSTFYLSPALSILQSYV